MRACAYGGGVLLLLVHPGAALLLVVAVLLQRVEHLIGQLQVHPQPVAHVHLRGKLWRQDMTVTTATAGGTAPLLIHRRSNFLSWISSSWLVLKVPKQKCSFASGCECVRTWRRCPTLSIRAVFLRPQVSSSCLVVMFLPLPEKPLRGVTWGFSEITHTHTHTVSIISKQPLSGGQKLCPVPVSPAL